MPRTDRILATLTTFMIGAAIAMIVAVITPDRQGLVIGWMIIGGVAGIVVGLPLWSSVWKRQQDPLRR